MSTAHVAGRSHQGRVRKTNEDAYRIYHEGGPAGDGSRGYLFAVADGIGSYRAGAQAAAMAVDQLALFFQLPDADARPDAMLQDLVFRANDVITRLRTEQKEYYGMGSTLTLLHTDRDFRSAVVFQAGDSMAYLLRRERLLAITSAQKTEGSELANHLGLGQRLSLEKVRLDLRPGDTLLLCSDGVCGPLSPEEMIEGLTISDNPSHCLDMLIARAIEKGDDNVTGIVVKISD